MAKSMAKKPVGKKTPATVMAKKKVDAVVDKIEPVKEESKKAPLPSGPVHKDELAITLAKALNSKMKSKDGLKAAYFLNDDDWSPTDLTEWIGTGSDMLDIILSNRPHGGCPVGRIIEIQGWEAAGKSLMCGHIIANTQKKGGIGVYIDTESAVNEDFFTAIGVDMAKMVYAPIETLEEVYQTVEDVITEVRKSDKKKLVTIVIDSASATTTLVEQDSTFEKDGWSTAKAIINSKAMRKLTNLIAKERILLVITQQLRMKLGVTFGDASTVSGGKAIGFHASGRIKLQAVGQIKGKVNGVEQVVGIQTEAKVLKSRMGPPLRKCRFNIYFDSGIDNYESWFATAVEYGIFNKPKGSSKCTYIDKETGEEIEMTQNTFVKLVENDPTFKEKVYNDIVQKRVLVYKEGDSINKEEIEIDDSNLQDLES